MSSGNRLPWWRRRWRGLVAGPAGLAAYWLAARAGLPQGLAVLIGWNLAAVLYLTTTLFLIWHAKEATVRSRAAAEDEGPSVTSIIIL